MKYRRPQRITKRTRGVRADVVVFLAGLLSLNLLLIAHFTGALENLDVTSPLVFAPLGLLCCGILVVSGARIARKLKE